MAYVLLNAQLEGINTRNQPSQRRSTHLLLDYVFLLIRLGIMPKLQYLLGNDLDQLQTISM